MRSSKTIREDISVSSRLSVVALVPWLSAQDLSPRAYLINGNFWFGGTTSLSGIEKPDTRQTSSRIGGTLSVPLGMHQSIKVAYSKGTYIRFGGDYHNFQVAWQYSWLGQP